MRISARAASIAPSATLEIDATAKRLLRQGVDLVAFGVGEPDFDTPRPIAEAASQAVREGKTRYTPAAGIPELREAIARLYGPALGVEVSPEQVVVGNGSKHAIHDGLQVLVEPGDEVLVLAPFWVSYPDLVRVSGGVPVLVSPNGACRPDVAAVRRAITPRTRGLILNSPNNPSGAVYRREELEALLQVARERDLWILSDEVYERLVYDGRESVSPAALGADARARTVVTSSVSKTYAMTGWRIGYLVAPAEVARAAATLQSQTTSNPNTPAQWAALAALTGDQGPAEAMRIEYDRRRRALEEGMRSIPGFEFPPMEGAFYAFPRVAPWFGRKVGGKEIRASADLAEALLSKARVVTVPGAAFGAEGHLRLSYATSLERIEEGIRRLRAFFAALD